MNRRAWGGLRGRVALTVLCVTAVLYSVLAVLLFLVVVHSGRDAIERRVDEVLDRMEADLRAGESTVRTETPDGIVATLVNPGDVPPVARGQLVVTRPIRLTTGDAVLVGSGSVAALNDSLRPLHRALWFGVPLASLFTALIAGLATRRALRPVDDITSLAARVGPGAVDRVPVPATGDEIERLALTVNEMLDRIAEGHRSMQRFTSDAAHELRTPLMALQGELEISARGFGDEGSLDRMQRQADRLAELVDGLVLLSTLDEGRPLSLTPTDLLALVRDEAEAACPSCTVVGPSTPLVGDEELLARAVRNLLGNARRHAASAVVATVATVDTADAADANGSHDAEVVLHVDDDGAGLDEASVARVFERFHRMDEARSADAGGAGLGLAIVESVARSHGGRVVAGRGPLGGARFTLTLPRGAVADQVRDERAMPVTPS